MNRKMITALGAFTSYGIVEYFALQGTFNVYLGISLIASVSVIALITLEWSKI